LTRVRGLLAALALAAAACGGAEPQPGAEARPAAPVSLRGAVVIEPPRLAIGEVAVVEVAVVTPPEHRVRPLAPPEKLPGLWLLDVETPPTQQEAGRWVHRTRFRVRARELGSFEWPAQEAQVERPGGEPLALALEARPFEVESVARELPGRVDPFGLRGPPQAEPRPGGFWGPALVGALGTLAALGLVSLGRRLRRAETGAETGGLVPGSASDEPGAEWREALAGLDGAERRAAADPRAAADQISVTLRRFVTRRFGLRADALTTEELAVATPPFAMSTRWPQLLAILTRLDVARFRAPGDAAGAELRAALGEARSLLSGYAPREELR
jgi:hypothetical protein